MAHFYPGLDCNELDEYQIEAYLQNIPRIAKALNQNFCPWAASTGKNKQPKR